MRRLKLLASFGLLQGGVQFLSALSGFILVRALDKSEFAAYTIASSMQVILNLLTDGGIGSGLNALGGRVWQDRGTLSRLINTAFLFRRQLAWIAIPVATLFSLFLLRNNEVSWLSSVLLVAVVITGLWGSWTVSVYAVPLRLHGRYLLVQRTELASALLRLALVGGMAFVFLNALLAVLIFVIASALQAVLLLRAASDVVDRDAPVDGQQRAQLSSLVRKQFFQVFFFAFQGQITIWLISAFGNTEKVADLGALARLGIIFALVGSIVTNIISPTFSRCDSIRRLRGMFTLSIVGYSAFSVVIMGISILSPEPLLWLVGPQYQTLTKELPWMMASGIVTGYTGIVHALAFGRGWIWHAWLIPIFTLAIQVILLFMVDLSSVHGVLLFGLVSCVPNFLLVSYMALRGFICVSDVGRSKGEVV